MIDSIYQSFDIWTDTQGLKSRGRVKSIDNISMEGIGRLRELILELAIQGKLVTQNNYDISARELLDKISIEKGKWIKDKKIKKEKPLLPIESKEIPFDLPFNWVWCRLADISILINGDRGKNYPSKEHYIEEGVPFITAANLGEKYLNYDTLNYISEERFNLLRSGEVESNDILYCLRGSLGKCAIVDKINNGAIASSLCIVRLITGINYEFLLNYFLSPLGKVMIKRHDNGTAQPNLSATDVKKYLFPLPPIEEQHRIVAKVDELMKLCDKLEEHQTNNLKTHQQLVKSLLETLTQAANAGELQALWERISFHFDTLFCTEDSIEQLKQTILQLAVMGMLVKQDHNDETARELLKQITKEKEKLVKEGKIKKQTPLPEMRENEKPFELPKGWVWCSLNDVSRQITDGEHITPPRIDSGYRLLSAKNVRDGFIDYENCDYVTKNIYEKCIKRCNPEIGDLLIISVGGTIGRTSLIKKNIPFVIVRSVAMIKPLLIESAYLELVMNSPLLQQIIANKSRGGAQPCLYLSEIVKFNFPLPPLAEQPKIVVKVKELFTLCDYLREKILKSQEIKNHLSKTIVESVQ